MNTTRLTMAILLATACWPSAALRADTVTSLEQPTPMAGFEKPQGASPAATATASEAAVLEPAKEPVHLIYVQISREYLVKRIDQTFEMHDDVRDNILGTELTGKAHSNGLLDVLLEENGQRIVGHVTCVGTIQSHTLGYKGPAVLHSDIKTEFNARKEIVLDHDGLKMLPATSAARSKATTTNIETDAPGLRGRLVRRAAWGRVQQTQAEVDQIASRHAEVAINRAFDRRVNESLASFQDMLKVAGPQLVQNKNGVPVRIYFSSTPTHITLVASNSDVAPAPILPHTLEGRPDVAVCVHRTVALRVMAEPAMMGQLVGQLFGDKAAKSARTVSSTKGGANGSGYKMTWSPKREWLVLSSPAGVIAAEADKSSPKLAQ